jgi:UDP-N-acetylmuramoylalanine-D-glutamate ligase
MNNDIREFRMLNRWMCLKEEKIFIADYLEKKGIRRLGIYGYGVMGKHLIRDLAERQYEAAWVMDGNAESDTYCRKIIRPNDKESTDDVDLIVITPIRLMEEIEVTLLKKGNDRIVSIEELVYDTYKWGFRG